MKKLSAFLLFLFLGTLMVVAQPNVDFFPTVEDTPVDGGLAALLALGIGYGVRKLYHKSR